MKLHHGGRDKPEFPAAGAGAHRRANTGSALALVM